MSEKVLIDSLIRSLQVGSLYALMALGITLTMSVIKLPNFAHAEYITVGAYTALIVSRYISPNPIIILVTSGAVSALTALLGHVSVFRPLEKQKPSIYTMLLASFATGLILRYILFLIADSFELFDLRIKIPLEVWYRNNWVILTNVFFWVVPLSIILVILLRILLIATPLGREMRALADNLELAKIIGIRVERVKILTWLCVGAIAGIAGALWGLYTSVNPLLGWFAILPVFAAAILGGMSSFTGTILGAYLVGLSENTLMQLLNFYLGIDFTFKTAIPFIIIIAVLLLRPQGFTDFFKTSSRLQR